MSFSVMFMIIKHRKKSVLECTKKLFFINADRSSSVTWIITSLSIAVPAGQGGLPYTLSFPYIATVVIPPIKRFVEKQVMHLHLLTPKTIKNCEDITSSP